MSQSFINKRQDLLDKIDNLWNEIYNEKCVNFDKIDLLIEYRSDLESLYKENKIKFNDKFAYKTYAIMIRNKKDLDKLDKL